jgi:hypothetical protein
MKKSFPDGVLNWYPELGYGWHPAKPIDYDKDYWLSYRERDDSAMGKSLTDARVKFVRRLYSGEIVDIGIGGGRFVTESCGKGFDVNKSAIKWLKTNDLYCDPYQQPVEAITCWDALEHIPEPEKLLAQVTAWVFVSIPIFTNGDSVIYSKHYKPGEHIWYFTERGLVHWMADQGFMLMRHTDIESQLGREGIMTYAFRRST